MLKRLPVLILFISFFISASAQTPVDSVAKQSPVDTIAKQPVNSDTVAKHQPVDTVAKHKPIDTVARRAVIDSVAKRSPIDTVVNQQPVDSLTKHAPIDTAIKHTPVDSVARPAHVDTVAKSLPVISPPVDSVSNHPPATQTVKHPPVKSPVKHPAVDIGVKPPPVIVIKPSPIKTISDRRYNAYLNGEDLDSMAMVGELNHYPLPDKALKYKVQIGLNPGQITKLKAMATELHRKKVEMGNNIIKNEKMLDSLFHSKQVVDGTLIFYTNRAGLYLGELRGAILMACYETEKILSDDQIKRLEALEKTN